MVKSIVEYFRNTENYSIVRFIFEMYLLALGLKMILIILISLIVLIFEPTEVFFFGDINETSSQFEDLSISAGLLFYCIIAPLMESVIGQVIPIYIAAFFVSHKLIQVVASSTVFTFFHSIETIAFSIIIFFAGLIFAWCFIVYKKSGLWKATMITAAVHGLYNFTGFLNYYSDFLIVKIQLLFM